MDTKQIFIGIDWADNKHAVNMFDPETGKHKQSELKHTPEDITEWAAQLGEQYPQHHILVCLEQGRGPLLTALSCIDWLTCYPINPKSSARYREALFPSRKKNDPTDARLLCDFLYHHHKELKPHAPLDPDSHMLHRLTGHRKKLVDERTRQLNRLRAELKMYFPQILTWFGTINTKTTWDFLLKWPTLDDLKKARKTTILKFMYAHRVRNSKQLTELPELVKQSTAMHTDDVIIKTSSFMVGAICKILIQLQTSIDQYDKLIANTAKDMPDRKIFETVPGLGPALLPRVIAAFGSDRSRFESAQGIQSLAGIAPVSECSGNSSWIHFRWAASSFIRQTFHEHALHSIAKSVWARRFYEDARKRGKSHHTAIRALAFKWLRILYACWKNNTPYDEEMYINALSKVGSKYAN